jgi:hypothetical protein
MIAEKLLWGCRDVNHLPDCTTSSSVTGLFKEQKMNPQDKPLSCVPRAPSVKPQITFWYQLEVYASDGTGTLRMRLSERTSPV